MGITQSGIFNQPVVRWFAVTGILAAVVLLLGLVYGVLLFLQKRQTGWNRGSGSPFRTSESNGIQRQVSVKGEQQARSGTSTRNDRGHSRRGLVLMPRANIV